MSIAPTLRTYLASKHIDYDLVEHRATDSSERTAAECRIPADRLAKGVVLRTSEGYMLAVLPASCRLRHEDLKGAFGRDCTLASEHELDQLFPDCAHGAVPPFGESYGLDVLVDDRLTEQPDVYLESGDHATLVHMSQAQFVKLMANARHGSFADRAL
jgi:Ala-tRNA(Pro) deacylase